MEMTQRELLRAADIRRTIVRALDAAASILTSEFSNVITAEKLKDDGSLIIDADLQAEKVIEKALRQDFPCLPIDSEEIRLTEVERAKAAARWIVDPLDGTENFASGVAHFGSAIGLVQNGKLIAGGVRHVFSGATYTFVGDDSAQLGSMKLSTPGNEVGLDKARVAFLPTYSTRREPTVLQFREIIYRAARRLVDNWCPSLDWCSLSRGQIHAIISYRESDAAPDFDMQIGRALFEHAANLNAHFQKIDILNSEKERRTLEIACFNPALSADLEVLAGELSIVS